MSSLARTEQVIEIFEDKMERRDLTLPILPRVAAMVIELSTDEESDFEQLSRLIQGDMALAGHIMRVANSAVYRPVTPFVSLQQAIGRLGMVTISEIALATSLNSNLFSAPGYEPLLGSYWHESLCCSAWSREIARMRRTNVESSFLAGLLCNIGKPVVVQGVSEFGLHPEEIFPLVDRFYRRAGALLAANWSLPEVVGNVIIQHGEEELSGYFSDITLNVDAGMEITLENEFSEAMTERLNFYPEDVEALLEKQPAINAWVATMDV